MQLKYTMHMFTLHNHPWRQYKWTKLPIKKHMMDGPIVHLLNLIFVPSHLLNGAGGNYGGGHIYQVSVGEGL